MIIELHVFSTLTCAPCKRLKELLDEVLLTGEYQEIEAVIHYREDSPGLFCAYGIKSVPTLVATRRGEEIGRVHGFRPRSLHAFLFEMCNLT